MLAYWRHQPVPPAFCTVHDLFIYFLFPFCFSRISFFFYLLFHVIFYLATIPPLLEAGVTQTFAEELTFVHEQSRRAFYPYDWTRI